MLWKNLDAVVPEKGYGRDGFGHEQNEQDDADDVAVVRDGGDDDVQALMHNQAREVLHLHSLTKLLKNGREEQRAMTGRHFVDDVHWRKDAIGDPNQLRLQAFAGRDSLRLLLLH